MIRYVPLVECSEIFLSIKSCAWEVKSITKLQERYLCFLLCLLLLHIFRKVNNPCRVIQLQQNVVTIMMGKDLTKEFYKQLMLK
jgi:hypothetical protein